MSWITIFRFREDGTALVHAQVTNAWAGSIAIWQALEQKYLPPYIPSYVLSKPWYTPGMSPDYVKKRLGYTPSRIGPGRGNAALEVFNLAQDTKVELNDRIVLLSTMEDILVRKENVPKVIAAFKSFEGNSNLDIQSRVLERLLARDDWIAIGWNQSSICSKDWTSRGGFDPNADSSLPYNCLTMHEHTWLFDVLK